MTRLVRPTAPDAGTRQTVYAAGVWGTFAQAHDTAADDKDAFGARWTVPAGRERDESPDEGAAGERLLA